MGLHAALLGIPGGLSIGLMLCPRRRYTLGTSLFLNCLGWVLALAVGNAAVVAPTEMPWMWNLGRFPLSICWAVTGAIGGAATGWSIRIAARREALAA